MKSRLACLGTITLALGFLALPVAARAQEDPTLPRPHDTRRDPFRNPMTPKERPEPPKPREPRVDPPVPPAVKNADATDPRAAVLSEFSARHIRVSGVVYELVPESIRLPMGMDLLGASLGSEIEIQAWRSRATAVVEDAKAIRLVADGDGLEDGVSVKRIERASVVFLYRDVEFRVPLGEGGL